MNQYMNRHFCKVSSYWQKRFIISLSSNLNFMLLSMVCYIIHYSVYLHYFDFPSYQLSMYKSLSKILQRDSNTRPLGLYKNAQPFSQPGYIIEQCCEYLYVRCIWLHVFIMSRTRFTVNPHSRVASMSRNSLLKTGAVSEV